MYRLLAEVKGVDLAERRRDRRGLECDRYEVRARIVGSAMDALPAPDGVVGRDVRLVRDCLRPWKVKRGDLVVLDAAESARVLCRRCPRAAEGLPKGANVRLETLDVDRDGFPEHVVSNTFTRAVFQWHRGARLASLQGSDGVDRLFRSYEYLMAGKYILLGGVEPFIAEAGSPGEVWKSAFEPVDGGGERDDAGRGRGAVREGRPVGGAYEAVYRRRLESPAGVTLTTTARVVPGLPGVMAAYRARYEGKPAGAGGEDAGGTGRSGGGREAPGGEDGKQDSTDVTIGLRVFPNPVGEVPSLNLFEIPCSDGVHTVRFHPPAFGRRWRSRDWRDEHFSVRGGFAVSRNEALGNAMVLLFDQRKTAFVTLRSDYTGPELDVLHVTKTLVRGRSHSVGAACLTADAVSVSGSSMLMAAVGSGRGGRRQVAFVLRAPGRSDRRRAAVECADGGRSLTLTPMALPGAGTIWTGTLELGRRAFPLKASAGAGASRLELELEG